MWRSAFRSRAALALALALLAPPSATSTEVAAPLAAERVYLTVDEALKLALPGCAIAKSVVYLTDAQKARATQLAGAAVEVGIVRPHAGTKDGKLVGTAYVDVHKVRTLKESLFVLVDPAGRVARIELLAFGEPDEYAPKGAWYAQFIGKPLDAELELRRGIAGIAGASLSARAATNAVRRVLALHQALNEPPPKEQR